MHRSRFMVKLVLMSLTMRRHAHCPFLKTLTSHLIVNNLNYRASEFSKPNVKCDVYLKPSKIN